MLSFPTVLTLLVAATLLAIASKRAQVPYSVALVIGGMLITISGALPSATFLDPGLVFYVLLPTLLFEGGLSADPHSIRTNAITIGTLAVLGTLIAIAVTGLGLDAVLPLPTISCFLLAAMLGGTDTVSILFTFRRAPVPQRLRELLAGETLFNDGVMLVAYAALVGMFTAPEPPTALGMTVGVVVATLGGIVVGAALGLLGGLLVRQAQDPMAEIMATTAIAFASYGIADALGVSGAIAGVAAGLAVSSVIRKYLSPQSRVAISSFWDYVVFGVNTFLFLGIGLSTSLQSIRSHLLEIGVAVALMFVGRAVAVYLPFLVLGMWRESLTVPMRWQHLFVAGNIKGALAVALALALPADLPARATLVDMAFGVTFVSLVGQGLMLGNVVRWLDLSQVDPIAEEIGVQQARLVAAHGGRRQLDALRDSGLLSRAAYDVLRGEYQISIARAERGLRHLQSTHLAQGARGLLASRRRLLDAERTAVEEARMSGIINESAAEALHAEIGARLVSLEADLSASPEPNQTEEA